MTMAFIASFKTIPDAAPATRVSGPGIITLAGDWAACGLGQLIVQRERMFEAVPHG